MYLFAEWGSYVFLPSCTVINGRLPIGGSLSFGGSKIACEEEVLLRINPNSLRHFSSSFEPNELLIYKARVEHSKK